MISVIFHSTSRFQLTICIKKTVQKIKLNWFMISFYFLLYQICCEEVKDGRVRAEHKWLFSIEQKFFVE